ncbi:TPA: hypothetical protein ACGT6A_002281 [Salmonella enterica]|nr:hypothetical protein [Salmonella enterica subsp. enterica serovar Newport]EFT4509979.1 hypothetical protein [Salmonella enterica subsp. enterica serovar Stanley]
MNKFEGVTVVHLENSDYTDNKLSTDAERETVTTDIVIDGGVIVKNRLDNTQTGNKTMCAHKRKQIENAQRLNAVINAFRFSWVELSGDEIEAILDIASEHACSIESYLTEMAEGENNENVQL